MQKLSLALAFLAAVVVDKVSTFDEPLALVGGYGALLAYDSSGTERMWTVTSNSGAAPRSPALWAFGAHVRYVVAPSVRAFTCRQPRALLCAVTALATADVDGDGQKEILVGTDDADIMVFKNEERVGEASNAAAT